MGAITSNPTRTQTTRKMENNQITLVQSPIIKHKLQEAGKRVSKRIEDLELDKQVATIQTVKYLKNLRTELNEELTDFETQRKFIKTGVNSPYLIFENLYKTEISEKYKSAIDTLKDSIATVENKVKSDKKNAVEIYFKELCFSEKIDFISFEKLGIDIKLSVTEKKYKEQAYDYVSKVIDDLKLIKSTDFEAETLIEYKSSLNVSSAITTVKTRKKNEAIETAKLKAETTLQRKSYLKDLGMQFVEITNAFEYNADIYITVPEIEDLLDDDYISKVSECEAKIKEIQAKKVLEKQAPASSGGVSTSEPVATRTIARTVPAPVLAPVLEKKSEPLKIASFQVTATMTQLRALGTYMKQNQITYKNI